MNFRNYSFKNIFISAIISCICMYVIYCIFLQNISIPIFIDFFAQYLLFCILILSLNKISYFKK